MGLVIADDLDELFGRLGRGAVLRMGELCRFPLVDPMEPDLFVIIGRNRGGGGDRPGSSLSLGDEV